MEASTIRIKNCQQMLQAPASPQPALYMGRTDRRPNCLGSLWAQKRGWEAEGQGQCPQKDGLL